MIDFSVSPFFDDFETSAKGKNYHKILFVPGNAVQARELTQIQSIIQEQIKRHGDAIFKNGTSIKDGEVFYDNDVVYLKISPSYASTTIESVGASLVGKTIEGTSGVNARVVHYESATSTDPATLYVKYTSANGTAKTFSVGEVLTNAELSASVQISTSSTSIGKGAIANIGDGIYYANGYFVGVSAQTITVSKYSNTPTGIVGLEFVESVVTSSTDNTLYDNASGFSNFAATGASRYKITLSLSIRNIDYTVASANIPLSFIPILTVVNGQIQKQTNNTQYSDIEKMLARRLFDEAGDFIVKDFSFEPKEYRSNKRGAWLPSTPYIAGDIVTNGSNSYTAMTTGYSGTTAPVHTYGTFNDGTINWLQVTNPTFNNGVQNVISTVLTDHVSAESKYAILCSNGKAYVSGFETDVQSASQLIANKARDVKQVNSGQVYTPNGAFIRVTNVTGIIDTGTMTKLNIRDAGNVTRGTAWASKLVYESGTIGTADAVYKLYIIDISMNFGYDVIDDVTNIVSTAGSTFSANIKRNLTQLSGVVSTTAASALVTGSGTVFTQELKSGDNISINGVEATVLSIQSDFALTLTANLASTLNNINLFSLVTDYNGINNYLTPLPAKKIRNTRTADGLNDISYNAFETFSFTTSGTSYNLVLTTGETFAGITSHNVVNTATNAIVAATYSLDITSTVLTISGLTTATAYKVNVLVKRSASAAKQKVKTFITDSIIVTSTNVTDNLGNVLSTAYNITSSKIPLFKADAIRIEKITMSGSTGAYNATGESDVTPWYKLEQNKNQEFYDISTITRLQNIIAPNKAIKVTFSYFSHSQGDYFSADSYSSIPYTMIPSETYSGITYNLADYIDTRNTRAIDGASFNGTGGVVSTPMDVSVPITLSYSFYLSRNDLIALQPTGSFVYVEGVSGSNTFPLKADNSMSVAKCSLDAYTNNPVNGVVIMNERHKRYTMQDIGNIETRLGNVEYYVALNELEKNTSSMQIYDANGLSRYKAGFIADPFVSTSVCESSIDLKCSIDTALGILTPQQNVQSITLSEVSGATQSSRSASHYQITGDYITLPFTQSPLIRQLSASREINVNPFASYNWNGVAKIIPETDNWVDVINVQNVINTSGGATSAASAQSIITWVAPPNTALGRTGEYNFSYNVTTGQANFDVAPAMARYNQETKQNVDIATALNQSIATHSDPMYKLKTTTSTQTSVSYSTSVVSNTTTDQFIKLPFARSIPIVYQMNGMRPFSRLYSFLDNSSIDANIYPCVQVTITNETGKFLGFNDTPASASSSLLRSLNLTDLQGDVQNQYPNGNYNHNSYINNGEVIRYYATPTSVYAAVVVARESQVNPVTKVKETVLHVTLMRNYTSASANTDNWTGIVNQLAWSLFPVGASIKGDTSGATATVSAISNPTTVTVNSNGSVYGFYLVPAGQVKAGKHNIVFTDSATNGSDSTSSATTSFTAFNQIDIATNTIVQRTEAHYSSVTTTTTSFIDPLAQSFIVPSTKTGGCFASSVDIYFSAVNVNETQPVIVQIVEMQNGYPTGNVLYNAVATKYASSISASATSLIPTRFEFPGLVYLKPNVDYAVKVLSNSNAYRVWIATMGDTDSFNPTHVIAENPNVGSLFKSQNNSTWTAEQTSDLTFVLNIAQFDITQGGTYSVENPSTAWTTQSLPSNPFTVLNGSTTVKTYSPNHGLFVGANVVISGSSDTGVPNGTYIVNSIVNNDSFVITAPSAFTFSGRTGGSAVKITKNYRYDAFVISAGHNYLIPQGTGITSTLLGSSASTKDVVSTSAVFDVLHELQAPKYIMSDVNEGTFLSGAKSLSVNFNLSSTSTDVSPVLNFREISIKAVNNRVNNPTIADNTTVDVQTIVSAHAGVTFTTTTNVINIPNTIDINQFKIGSYITISGTTSNNITTKITNIDTTGVPYMVYVNSALTTESPASTTIVEQIGFVDSITPVGDTAEAIYLTHPMILSTPSTALQVMLTSAVPTSADVKVYYRTLLSTDIIQLNKVIWHPLDMNYKKSDTLEYVDQSYTLNGLPNFKIVQFKIVMVSTNTAFIPKCKNFRAIALA